MVAPRNKTSRIAPATGYRRQSVEKDKNMIARIESRRQCPPLNEACVTYHRLEALTAAWGNARALGNYPTADLLLVERNALLQQIAHRVHDAQGGTQ